MDMNTLRLWPQMELGKKSGEEEYKKENIEAMLQQ
jgi:hypothetical protein